MTPPRTVHVGRVARAHGLRGQLRLNTFDHAAPSLQAGVTVQLHLPGGAVRPALLREVHRVTDGVLVRVDGVADKTAADALRGAEVHVPEDALPALADGEHWVFRMAGSRVVAPDGRALGEVITVDEGPAHPVLRVRTPDGREREVPWVAALVRGVDAAARTVTVEPLPGLLDDEAEDAGDG